MVAIEKTIDGAIKVMTNVILPVLTVYALLHNDWLMAIFCTATIAAYRKN
jgi:hypothetical protein